MALFVLVHSPLVGPVTWSWVAHDLDGVLPKWSEWFGPETMETLVPDPRWRAAVVAELPELPLAYFESRVPVPSGWARIPGRHSPTRGASRPTGDRS